MRSLAALCVLVSFALLACRSTDSDHREVTIAAAASLRGVMPDLMAKYAESHPNVKVSVSYGASGDLRQQVEAGAPVDVVVFASGKPVDDLVHGHFADGATRKVIATNQLVLIGPKGGKPYTFATLDTLPEGDKLAIGDPKTVPAGQYAQAALEKLGKWAPLQSRFVYAADVAAVLAYARRGEVAAAIVYKTETHGIADVVTLDELKGDAAPRVEIVAAATTKPKFAPEARGFVDFLGGADAAPLLRAYGFGAP